MAKKRLNVGAFKSKTEHLCYTRAELEAMLPKVGEKMMRVPSALADTYGIHRRPQPCTVVAVNLNGLWYRVYYEDLGFSECYKVPESQLGPNGGVRR